MTAISTRPRQTLSLGPKPSNSDSSQQASPAGAASSGYFPLMTEVAKQTGETVRRGIQAIEANGHDQSQAGVENHRIEAHLRGQELQAGVDHHGLNAKVQLAQIGAEQSYQTGNQVAFAAVGAAAVVGLTYVAAKSIQADTQLAISTNQGNRDAIDGLLKLVNDPTQPEAVKMQSLDMISQLSQDSNQTVRDLSRNKWTAISVISLAVIGAGAFVYKNK